MLPNQINVSPPPSPWDGWFLKEQINLAVGINDIHQRLSFNGVDLLVRVDGLTQEQQDDIVAAIGAYVHPGDTTKNMRDVSLEGVG